MTRNKTPHSEQLMDGFSERDFAVSQQLHNELQPCQSLWVRPADKQLNPCRSIICPSCWYRRQELALHIIDQITEPTSVIRVTSAFEVSDPLDKNTRKKLYAKGGVLRQLFWMALAGEHPDHPCEVTHWQASISVGERLPKIERGLVRIGSGTAQRVQTDSGLEALIYRHVINRSDYPSVEVYREAVCDRWLEETGPPMLLERRVDDPVFYQTAVTTFRKWPARQRRHEPARNLGLSYTDPNGF